MVIAGLIGEGVTDHITIRHILAGWYKEDGPTITELQPLETEIQGGYTPGNWDQVLKYCASSDFRSAFESNKMLHVIIQLDVDVFRSKEVSEDLRFEFVNKDGQDLTTEEIIAKIREKVIGRMGESVYEEYKNRIIFAIAVDSIECWFLPFYGTTKAHRTKEVNCLGTLNHYLNAKFNFTIDAKSPKYYHKVAKPLSKHKDLHKLYQHNKSLQIFCDSLPT